MQRNHQNDQIDHNLQEFIEIEKTTSQNSSCSLIVNIANKLSILIEFIATLQRTFNNISEKLQKNLTSTEFLAKKFVEKTWLRANN